MDGGATPSFAGTSATVTGSGALELAGTVSDLTANINIANSSTATAGVVVTGQNQIVSGIDGAGNVQVSTGGSATANHITAGSLVIGNGGTFTLAPSDAGGNPLAQGASTTVAAASAASAAMSLPTNPAASLPVADNLRRPRFSGDWFSRQPDDEVLSSHASQTTDDAVPPAFRTAAAAVGTFHPELVDVLFENRWAPSSGESYSPENSTSDAVDDELVTALAAELNPWDVDTTQRP